jgi:hypothetical protein
MARKPIKQIPTSDRSIPTVRPPAAPWLASNGTYLSGRAAIDEADALEVELEMRWGRGRLPLLVSEDLRLKFYRQKYLFSHARWNGELIDVQRESRRMATAWKALDRAAKEAGHVHIDPAVFEVTLADGTVAAIVREPDLANKVAADGRKINVYTLEEIGRMISAFPELVAVKTAFPGATVEKTRMKVENALQQPLDGEGEGILDPATPLDAVDGFNVKVGDDIPF